MASSASPVNDQHLQATTPYMSATSQQGAANEVVDNDWTTLHIDGKTYLSTGLALFEFLVDDEFSHLRKTQTVDEQQDPAVLYPYRNMETQQIVEPGQELLQESLPVITDIIAREIAGLPWEPPANSRSNIARQQLAVRRAQFDLNSGADRATVLQRMHEQLAMEQTAGDIEGSNSDDGDMDWDQVRHTLDGDGGATAYQPSPIDTENTSFDDEDDDDTTDGEDEEQDGPGFHPTGYVVASTKIADDDDDGNDTSPPSFGNDTSGYGVVNNAPAGIPVLNINCNADEEVPAHDDTPERYVEASKYRQLLMDMAELDGDDVDAQGTVVNFDDDDDDGADNNNDNDLDSVDDLPVLKPNNVLLDRRGRVAQRLDNALVGGTAKQAHAAQQRREAEPVDFSQKRTITQVMQADKPKTLGDDLKGFGLSKDMLDSLNKQGVLNQAADADYPKDFDEIAHLAQPFNRSSTAPTESSSASATENAEKNSPAQATVNPRRQPLEKVVSSKREQHNAAKLTIEVSLGELFGLHQSVTAQLQSLAKLSDQVDRVILAKMIDGDAQ